MDTAADFEDRRLIRAALRDLLKRKRGHISHLVPRKSLIKLSVTDGFLFILCFWRPVSPASPRQARAGTRVPAAGSEGAGPEQRWRLQTADGNKECVDGGRRCVRWLTLGVLFQPHGNNVSVVAEPGQPTPSPGG